MEAHLQGTANRLTEYGHDLVIVSYHPGACPLCVPWENKVLSITGKAEGYPTLDEAKAAGLFHPNCRHAYGLHIDLDKEIELLEEELGENHSPVSPTTSDSIADAMSRIFTAIGTLQPEVYNILKETYGIKDATIHISQDTISHIITGHPEFAGIAQKTIKDILKNADVVQRNIRADTVRIIARNDTLNAPIEIYKPGKLVVLVLRLQPAHRVNFVKALYPRDKIRKSDILWKKEQ